MKKVYLLRHAKAELGDASTQDYERSLSSVGRQDAEALGQWLRQQQVSVDKLLCSSAVRTRQTLEAVEQSWPEAKQTHLDEALYLASCGDLLHQLQMQDDAISSAMLIGHNPGLHEICLLLSGKGDARALQAVELKFPTCALAMIDCDVERWKELAPAVGALIAYRGRHDS